MATLQNLYDVSYNILREDQSDVSAYPLSLVGAFLNWAQLDFCSGNIINPVPMSDELKYAKKWQLPFLDSTAFYTNIAPVYLTYGTWPRTFDSILALGYTFDSLPPYTFDDLSATSLIVGDTSNYPTSWKVFIQGAIVPYTGKTEYSLTGCTLPNFTFQAGAQVSPVFTLPTDYLSTKNVVYNNSVKLEAQLYDDVFEMLNQYKGTNYHNDTQSVANNNSPYYSKPFYTLINSTDFVIWNLNQQGAMIRLRYEKKPTTMTLVSDTTTIDNDTYSTLILPYLAIAELLYSRGEEDRAQKLYNHAVARCKKAYIFYNNQVFEDINGKRVMAGRSGRRLNI